LTEDRERASLEKEIAAALKTLPLSTLKRVHRAIELLKYHTDDNPKPGDDPTTRDAQRAAHYVKR
jgi:hypothetical protein